MRDEAAEALVRSAPEFNVPDDLQDAIRSAGYHQADLEMSWATIQAIKSAAAEETGHLAFGIQAMLPLGAAVHVNPDVPDGIARLKMRPGRAPGSDGGSAGTAACWTGSS